VDGADGDAGHLVDLVAGELVDLVHDEDGAALEVELVEDLVEDALAARILVAEHRLYPSALAMIAGGAAKFPED
jgi:folate-dependent phosphoribosylglycinamide formyltransferase PurN